jgi:hypothetical protein
MAAAIGRVLGPEIIEGYGDASGLTPTFPKNCVHTWSWKPTGCVSRIQRRRCAHHRAP